MAYCTKEQLLVGTVIIASNTDLQQYVDFAASDIDARISGVYKTPIVLENLKMPGHRDYLRNINIKLATGRFLLTMAIAGEDTTPHSYGAYLLQEGDLELKAILDGRIDLIGAERIDGSVIDDPVLTDPLARTPSITNADVTSPVTAFEVTLHNGVWTPWSPGDGVRGGALVTAVTFELEDKNLRVALKITQDKMSARGLEKFFRNSVAEIMSMQIINTFANEGGGPGGSWKPLTKATVRIREDEGFPGAHPINERTGDMLYVLTEKREFRPESAYSASMGIPGRTGGTVAKKIMMAQHGGVTVLRGHAAWTPARPVLFISEVSRKQIMSSLSAYIASRAGKPWGGKAS